jgi:hypothetical protein
MTGVKVANHDDSPSYEDALQELAAMKERIAQLEAVISKGPTVVSSPEKVAFQEESAKGVDPSADDDNPEVGEVGFEASIWDGIIVVGLPMLNPDSGRPLIQPGPHFTICFLWI